MKAADEATMKGLANQSGLFKCNNKNFLLLCNFSQTHRSMFPGEYLQEFSVLCSSRDTMRQLLGDLVDHRNDLVTFLAEY